MELSERQLVTMRTMVNCFHNDINAHVIIRPCFDNDMCALCCVVSAVRIWSDTISDTRCDTRCASGHLSGSTISYRVL